MRLVQTLKAAAPGRKRRFSVSIRVKAMAFTVIVLVSMSTLIGLLVQTIAYEEAGKAHEARINVTRNQLASQYQTFADTHNEAEIGRAFNDALAAPGIVFAAAFDIQGNVATYARSTDYPGPLAEQLRNYGRHGDDTLFSPLPEGYELVLSEQPVHQRVTWQKSRNTNQGPLIGTVLVAHTTRQMQREFAVVQKKIWSVIAVVGVIAALVSWLATHRLIRPIYQLIRGTRQIAQGNLDQPVTVKSRDELRVLADSFNSMSAALRDTLERLDQQNRNLEAIVHDRTRELAEANLELQTLDKMKDGFLSSISHEFRTPLTSIKAFTEILLSDPSADPKDNEEFLQIIKRETDRMESLVNDVLDLVRIESGEMPFSFSTTAPSQPVRGALQAMSAKIRAKHLQVRVTEHHSLPSAQWDSAKVTRVVQELLANAVRYSPKEGVISLDIDREDDFARFTLRDQGPGIPEHVLGEVFKKFRQIGETLTSKPAGTGLGLPICRLIADKHGGTLEAEIPEDGTGAQIVLRLPFHPPGMAEQAQEPIEQPEDAAHHGDGDPPHASLPRRVASPVETL